MIDTISRLCEVTGRLESVIESSTNAIFEIDEDGKILSANPAFLYLFDIPDIHTPKKTIFQIIPGSDLNHAIALLFSEKESVFSKNIFIDLDRDAQFLLNLKLFTLPNGSENTITGIIQDQTAVLHALKNRDNYINSLHGTIHELRTDSFETIYHLAKLAEIHDKESEQHLFRVAAYAKVLGMHYFSLYREKYNWLSDQYFDDLANCSVLHDVGKIAVTDTILLKNGKFSKKDHDAMKQHTIVAAKAFEDHKGKKDSLAMGREISLSHHERWDGQGYPNGLQGEAIPLSARVVALCDVYDALLTEKPYKKAFSHKKAVKLIMDEKGKAFDPELVYAFYHVQDDFHDIFQASQNHGSKAGN